jgi:hypothetical protein
MASLYNIPFVRHNPWFRWYIGTGYFTTKARSSRRGRIEDTIAALLRELRAFVVKYLTLSVSSQISVAIEYISQPTMSRIDREAQVRSSREARPRGD